MECQSPASSHLEGRRRLISAIISVVFVRFSLRPGSILLFCLRPVLSLFYRYLFLISVLSLFYLCVVSVLYLFYLCSIPVLSPAGSRGSHPPGSGRKYDSTPAWPFTPSQSSSPGNNTQCNIKTVVVARVHIKITLSTSASISGGARSVNIILPRFINLHPINQHRQGRGMPTV